MKQVAVLGASSMLGMALCRLVESQGITVIRIGRSPNSDIQMDLADSNFFNSKVDLMADAFFHCAASFYGEDSVGVVKNFSVNSHSALMVAQLAAQLGCKKMIYAGTLSSAQDFDPVGYGSYGFSKALAEQQFMWLLGKANIRFCSLRLPQLYDSFGECIKHQAWFGRAVAYAAKGVQLKMPEASAERNFLHVDDAARLLFLASQQQLDGILNAVHPHSISMQGLVELAYQIFDRGGSIQYDCAKVPFRELRYPKDRSCWDLLGDGPATSLEETFIKIKLQGLENKFGPLDVS